MCYRAVSLDLAAAFDTIDYQVLVRRLEHTFGVKRSALSCAKSYLEGRSCFLKVGNAKSTTLRSDTNVPQGSVLGQLLFSLLTTPLGDVISSFGVKCHEYADDMQIYFAVNKDSLSKATLDLAGCTDAVYEWLLHNSLALNPDKSEVAMFGTAQRVGMLKQSASVAVAGLQIALSDHVKSRGMTFHSHLSFNKHINSMLFP